MNWLRWNRMRYSAYAPIYDLVVQRAGFVERGRRRAIELAGLRAGERVLIVAAGTGLDLPHVPAGVEVVATDIADGMIARLGSHPARARVDLKTVQTDAGQLALAAAAFDCVFLHLAIAVVPDPVGTMREVRRVLRPGGRVSIFDKFLVDGATPSWTRRLASAAARVVATELNRELGPLLEAGGFRLVAREDVGMGGLFVAARADKPV